MMRFIRQYGLMVALSLGIVLPALGVRLTSALTLPTQRFRDLQDIRFVSNQLRETPGQAEEMTQKIIENEMSEAGVNGSPNVHDIIVDQNNSSIHEIENLSISEKQHWITRIQQIYSQSHTMIDTAKLLSSKTAIIHHPGDGEGRGFEDEDNPDYNSNPDIITDLNQYHDLLKKTLEQEEEIEDLWNQITDRLSQKPTFLPEKYDTDYYVVCVDYLPGTTQLYPEQYKGMTMEYAELYDPYESILSEIETSKKREKGIDNRLTDETDDPLKDEEIQIAENQDLEEIYKADDIEVAEGAQDLGDNLESKYGSSFEPAVTLKNAAAASRNGQGGDLVDEQLADVAENLENYLESQNTELLNSLENNEPGALDNIRAALGEDGEPLVDQYESLLESGDRLGGGVNALWTASESAISLDPKYSGESGALGGALSDLRMQISDSLDKKALEASSAASGVSSAANSETPGSVFAKADYGGERVEWRSGVNSENQNSYVSRLINIENYKNVISAELDLWKEQEEDYKYLTELTKALNEKVNAKPPTN